MYRKRTTGQRQTTYSLLNVAGLGALLIALLTVSFQAVRTALLNPVRSLRNE